VNSQTTNKKTEPDTNSFQYLVGTDKLSGYDLKVCKKQTVVEPVKAFSNGRSAPILQVYVINKKNYVGGILENEKGKKTSIKDITLTPKENTLVFTVVGKDFSMSFDLNTGALLKEEELVTVFYTEQIGAWKINKK
jgi:hypothetical protein